MALVERLRVRRARAAALALGLCTACSVTPAALVECRSDGDCGSGERCEADRCVDVLCPAGTRLALWSFDADAHGAGISNAAPASLAEACSYVWDGAMGEPEPGSLRLSVPFTGAAQWVEMQLTPPSGTLDLRGAVIRAKVILDRGLTTSLYPGSAQLVAKTGPDYVFGSGPRQRLEAGVWTELVLEPERLDYSDPGWEPALAREISIEIETGQGADSDYETAELHLDSTVVCAGGAEAE